MSERTIIVGDIHGCFDELLALVQRAELRPEDHLVSIGDTVVKGPDPHSVLEYLTSRPNTTCLQGNMEVEMLEVTFGDNGAEPTVNQAETLQILGDDWKRHSQAMKKWPKYLDLGDYLCVHAGIRPGLPIDKQVTRDLTQIRRIRIGSAACGPSRSGPWWQFHFGPKVIVFGHTVMPEPMKRKWAIGIDTGCVYGGQLSALVLPERKIIQVEAKKTYATR